MHVRKQPFNVVLYTHQTLAPYSFKAYKNTREKYIPVTENHMFHQFPDVASKTDRKLGSSL